MNSDYIYFICSSIVAVIGAIILWAIWYYGEDLTYDHYAWYTLSICFGPITLIGSIVAIICALIIYFFSIILKPFIIKGRKGGKNDRLNSKSS